MFTWAHLHRRPLVYVYPQKGVKKGKKWCKLVSEVKRPYLHGGKDE